MHSISFLYSSFAYRNYDVQVSKTIVCSLNCCVILVLIRVDCEQTTVEYRSDCVITVLNVTDDVAGYYNVSLATATETVTFTFYLQLQCNTLYSMCSDLLTFFLLFFTLQKIFKSHFCKTVMANEIVDIFRSTGFH